MIQIFGTKKCKETQKAIRFLKERKIDFQMIDLDQKGPSEGELKNISRFFSIDELIDTNSKIYKKMNLAYMDYDSFEEILEEPLLLKTPVIRNKNMAVLGFDTTTIKKFIS